MRMMFFIFIFLMAAACSERQPEEPKGELKLTNPMQVTADHIAWYSGSVDKAFAEAKKHNKPLLLYWGAIWCPPCNELKATVFKQASFIEKTRSFIPVYLDGDTQRAQMYGEKFAVKGYPTLIVFDSQGTEITRIPGGMELDRYHTILNLVLDKIKPVKSLVMNIQNGLPPTINDCTLLAYYSWRQDNQQVLPATGISEILKEIHDACPVALVKEKSRLYLEYLHAVIQEIQPDNEKHQQPYVDNETLRQKVLARLNTILTTPALVMSNIYYLRYEDGTTIKALTGENSQERNILLANWHKAMELIANARHLTDTERVGALYAEVSLYKIAQQGKLTSAQQQAVKQTIYQARDNIDNKYEHSAVVNMMRNILVHAEMHNVAEQLIAEEINNAASPYYFMLELADFAQKEGRTDEALKWYEKAYRESAQGATRFQWGVNYLGGLTEMAPTQEAKILALSLELIDLLANSQDSFYNRNIARLKTMEQHLREWNKNGEYSETIVAIRSAMGKACPALDRQSRGFEQCRHFLGSKLSLEEV